MHQFASKTQDLAAFNANPKMWANFFNEHGGNWEYISGYIEPIRAAARASQGDLQKFMELAQPRIDNLDAAYGDYPANAGKAEARRAVIAHYLIGNVDQSFLVNLEYYNSKHIVDGLYPQPMQRLVEEDLYEMHRYQLNKVNRTRYAGYETVREAAKEYLGLPFKARVLIPENLRPLTDNLVVVDAQGRTARQYLLGRRTPIS